MKIVFFWMMACLCYLSTNAQVPEAFNYQAIARDPNGSPYINANISLQISILQGTSPGTEVYKETHTVLTNKLGLFNLEVGHGQPQSGGFESIDWGSGDHYIKTEIDLSGGTNFTLLGETRLLSVPYALFAGNGTGGENTWQENSEGIDYTNGFVGIGTDNPTHLLTLDGDEGTGEERFFLNLNNSSVANRSFAAMKATAGGGLSMTTFGHNSETYDSDNFSTADFGGIFNNGAGIHLTAGRNDGVIKLFTGIGGNGFSFERMRISADGNIGIGTAEPVAKLQVSEGDVYIEDINNGVILKSPNGNCWRMTANNDGSINMAAVICPN